jgi:hypothetical protein
VRSPAPDARADGYNSPAPSSYPHQPCEFAFAAEAHTGAAQRDPAHVLRRRAHATPTDDCNEAGAACSRNVAGRENNDWGGAPQRWENSDEDNSADEDDGTSNRAAGKDQEPDMDENELGMLSATDFMRALL